MKLPVNEHRIWDLRQVKIFVKNVEESVGGVNGWEFLSNRMKRALISEEVLQILMANDREQIPAKSMTCLYWDMMRVSGLIEDYEVQP